MAKSSSSQIVLLYLRYVLAAAEKGSFRQAAAELGVRESSISRGIRDLEDEIGVTLFIRNSGGVTLTNAGRAFLHHARIASSRIEYALKDSGAAGRAEVGMVRIGIRSSLASGFLADLLHAFQVEHPLVHLDFVEGGSADHVAAIQHHRMDVAFLIGEVWPRSCDTIRLWEERVFVVLPEDHKLSDSEDVGWDDLRSEHFIVSETNPGPEIHDYLVKNLAEFGHHPSVERCGVGRDNLMRLVTLCRGLTVTTEAMTGAAFPGVTYRPINGERLLFSAVWSLRNDNPALRRLLSMARTLSKRTAKIKAQGGATAAL